MAEGNIIDSVKEAIEAGSEFVKANPEVIKAGSEVIKAGSDVVKVVSALYQDPKQTEQRATGGKQDWIIVAKLFKVYGMYYMYLY